MATHSAPHLWAALITAMALTATLLAVAPAAAASPTACQVRNLDTGATKASLQKSHNAARAGHRLTVRGTCYGATRIRKSLTITGIRKAGSGKPILDAKRNGTVVKVVAGVKVTMKSLTVRRGAAIRGGGISNRGTLVLRDVVVRDNMASVGGGVLNYGYLMLKGSSSIRGNNADLGGGVLNHNVMATFTLKDSSSITRNSAGSDGGGVYNDTGALTMRDSSRISQNMAGVHGGGVANLDFGALRMRGSSSISGNDASNDGGGVYNEGILDGVRWEELDTDLNNVHTNTPDNVYLAGK